MIQLIVKIKRKGAQQCSIGCFIDAEEGSDPHEVGVAVNLQAGLAVVAEEMAKIAGDYQFTSVTDPTEELRQRLLAKFSK